MDTVNEQSTAYLTVEPLDKAGAAEAPASATYRIDCLTTGTPIRDDTALTPSAAMEIVLTPTDNRICTQANRSEHRQVTVTAIYGAGDQVNGVFDYRVANLGAVA